MIRRPKLGPTTDALEILFRYSWKHGEAGRAAKMLRWARWKAKIEHRKYWANERRKAKIARRLEGDD